MRKQQGACGGSMVAIQITMLNLNLHLLRRITPRQNRRELKEVDGMKSSPILLREGN